MSINRLNSWIRKAERFVDRPWYPLFMAAIGFVDNFIFVIPIAGVQMTSIFALPRRWFGISAGMILGNAVGAVFVAALVLYFGHDFLAATAPSLTESSWWQKGEAFLQDYGLIALFVMSAAPVTDHPMIALVSLAKHSLFPVFLVILVGKAIKYFFIGWMSAKMPEKLLALDAAKKETDF